MKQHIYTKDHLPTAEEAHAIVHFLAQHLEQYGDPEKDIEKALRYALGYDNKPGGSVLVMHLENDIVGAIILNQTGMEDYIPENILVYIATHSSHRGKGIGKQLMQTAIQQTKGAIALHVEPDNPAKKLYEYFGFTNKYLEMRLQKQ